jgi:Kef-type K+ transport system membrane component KefB
VDLILALLLLFGVARLAGEGMERIRQSPMLGEVLAGILLGPTLLGWIDPNPATSLGASLGVVSTLGIFVLVLLAGMELGREGLHQAFQERSAVVAAVEFILPFSLGYAFASTLHFDVAHSLFLATAMAVTALPVSVRILLDLNLLHSRLGRAIVSVALANDLIAFAVLGLVVSLYNLGGGPLDPLSVAAVLLKIVGFVALILLIARALGRVGGVAGDGPSAMQRVLEKLKAPESAFALCIALAFLLATAAEALGIHFAVGVFYAGVLITPQLVGREQFNQIRRSMSAVSFGLLTPVFFGFVGLQFTLTGASLPLIFEVTAIGFIGKFVGGILGGFVAGFRGAPLVALGFGLNARGMMELVLAQVGLAAGIIGPDLYSALIVMTLVTTLIAPPIMKRLLRRFHLEDVLPAVAAPASRPRPPEDLPKQA